jgi:hypothetical protein
MTEEGNGQEPELDLLFCDPSDPEAREHAEALVREMTRVTREGKLFWYQTGVSVFEATDNGSIMPWMGLHAKEPKELDVIVELKGRQVSLVRIPWQEETDGVFRDLAVAILTHLQMAEPAKEDFLPSPYGRLFSLN